jgi:hypothetical protein
MGVCEMKQALKVSTVAARIEHFLNGHIYLREHSAKSGDAPATLKPTV